MDELRDDLTQNHPDVQITDFDFYDVSIFNRCEQSRNMLAVIGKWSCVHPMLKVLPVQWDHAIPFGILHPPAPSPMLARFLDAVRAVVQEKQEKEL